MKDAETLYEGKRLKLMRHRDWEFVQRRDVTGAVAIAAMTPDGKVLFVEQERIPPGKRTIELPAGIVGDEDRGESEETSARRELLEETGYECAEMRLASRGCPTSPGITSELISFFVATGLKKKEKGGGVEGENITVHEVPFEDVPRWLRERESDGVMIDAKVWAGLYFLR